MRAIVQRVSHANVTVDGNEVGSIQRGLLVLIGVAPGDDAAAAQWMAAKVARLRVFPDENGRMNRSLLEIGGGALVVSQFTLYGDASRGNRPSFAGAAGEETALPRYEEFCTELAGCGVPVERGRFGAMMQVALVNDGPVTIILER